MNSGCQICKKWCTVVGHVNISNLDFCRNHALARLMQHIKDELDKEIKRVFMGRDDKGDSDANS